MLWPNVEYLPYLIRSYALFHARTNGHNRLKECYIIVRKNWSHAPVDLLVCSDGVHLKLFCMHAWTRSLDIMLFFFRYMYVCGTYDKTCSNNKFCSTRSHFFIKKKHITGASTHLYEGLISYMNIGFASQTVQRIIKKVIWSCNCKGFPRKRWFETHCRVLANWDYYSSFKADREERILHFYILIEVVENGHMECM